MLSLPLPRKGPIQVYPYGRRRLSSAPSITAVCSAIISKHSSCVSSHTAPSPSSSPSLLPRSARPAARYIDAGVYLTDNESSFFGNSKLWAKRKGRSALKTLSSVKSDGRGCIVDSPPTGKGEGYGGSYSSDTSDDGADEDSSGRGGGRAGIGSTRASSRRKLNFESRRYTTNEVGRLKDLKIGSGVRLEAECFRPYTSVTTTVRVKTLKIIVAAKVPSCVLGCINGSMLRMHSECERRQGQCSVYA